MSSGGDWLLLQELLERGDPEFVDRLRSVTDADALGRSPTAGIPTHRQKRGDLLLAYLERPLNAYRHEALIKRLFKQAEAAGDDAVMARFLVAFDRLDPAGSTGQIPISSSVQVADPGGSRID